MRRDLHVNDVTSPAHRRRPGAKRRNAVAAVEAALLLPICLVGLIALLDLALSVVQHNSLAECARRASRTAIVRGERSTAVPAIGPEAWSGTADQSHPLTDGFRPLLTCMPPNQVHVAADWPDGRNRSGDRVHVVLTYQHRSLVTALFGGTPWELTASSTMRVVH